MNHVAAWFPIQQIAQRAAQRWKETATSDIIHPGSCTCGLDCDRVYLQCAHWHIYPVASSSFAKVTEIDSEFKESLLPQEKNFSHDIVYVDCLDIDTGALISTFNFQQHSIFGSCLYDLHFYGTTLYYHQEQFSLLLLV